MRRLAALLSAVIVLSGTVVLTVAAPAHAGDTCTAEVKQALGYCPTGTTNGDFVEVIASKSSRGQGGGKHATPVVNIDNYTPPPPPPSPFEVCLDAWEKNRSCYAPLEPTEPGEEAPEPVEIPPITITDLASFAPETSLLTGEPENLGVAGLPANFVATAEQHTQHGTLFGFPISVRFTPAAFTFHYGDGQTLTNDTGGQSWEALRLPQFTPTDTSHTYTERGTYTARVDVAYTAEIDLGGGWFSITGELTTTGAGQDIRIYEAHTALVAHTCTEDPDGPGC